MLFIIIVGIVIEVSTGSDDGPFSDIVLQQDFVLFRISDISPVNAEHFSCCRNSFIKEAGHSHFMIKFSFSSISSAIHSLKNRV